MWLKKKERKNEIPPPIIKFSRFFQPLILFHPPPIWDLRVEVLNLLVGYFLLQPIHRLYSQSPIQNRVKQKDITDICFLKISKYVFNIFNDSTEDDNFTTVLTSSNTNPRLFSENHWFLKTGKRAYILSNSLSYVRKYSIYQN